MIHRFSLAFLLIMGFNLGAQEAWLDKTRVLPELLRKVPVAIFIQHNPNPNYPELNETGRNQNAKYVWKHSTTVCFPLKNLTVVKAGSFIWYDETGWKANVEYSKKDFRLKFGSPGGELQKGSCYTFEENYRWGSNLYGGDALWYVLATDDAGVTYKGIGLIETESEIQN